MECQEDTPQKERLNCSLERVMCLVGMKPGTSKYGVFTVNFSVAIIHLLNYSSNILYIYIIYIYICELTIYVYNLFL